MIQENNLETTLVLFTGNKGTGTTTQSEILESEGYIFFSAGNFGRAIAQHWLNHLSTSDTDEVSAWTSFYKDFLAPLKESLLEGETQLLRQIYTVNKVKEDQLGQFFHAYDKYSQNDPLFDEILDLGILNYIRWAIENSQDMVIEGRTAVFYEALQNYFELELPLDNPVIICAFLLTVSDDTAAHRVYGLREKGDYDHLTAVEKIRDRNSKDHARYQQIYGIDLNQPSEGTIVIDTNQLDIDEVHSLIIAVIQQAKDARSTPTPEPIPLPIPTII